MDNVDAFVTGWLVSGPNATVVVYDRELIKPIIQMLAKLGDNDEEDYTATKVNVNASFHPDSIVSEERAAEIDAALGIKR